jgi:hypothetical protein
MATPAYVTASAGTTDASGAWTHTGPSPGAAGRLYLVHVLQDGTNAGVPAITSVTNAENLSGVDNVLTKVGQFDVGNPAAARHHVWLGRSLNTSAMVITGTNSGGDDVYVRVYVFSGASTSTDLAHVIENGTRGGTVVSTGTSNTAADASVTSLGPDRLAINLLAIDDDNPVGAFTGQTGGTWAETVAEYATATGTDGCIQIQTATITAAGTIDGGTASITDSDNWGVVGFALLPSGPAVYSGAVVTPVSANRVTAGRARRSSQVSTTTTVGVVTSGILPTRGVVSWADFTNPLPVSVKGIVSLTPTWGATTAGRLSLHRSAVSFVEQFNVYPFFSQAYSGRGYGSGTYGDAIQYAAVSVDLAADIVAQGEAVNPQLVSGAASFTITADTTADGVRTTFGAVAAPETITVASIGHTEREEQALGLIVTYDTATGAVVTAMGATDLPIAANILTRSTTAGNVAGNVGAQTAFTATTSGVVTAMGQTQFKFSLIGLTESVQHRRGMVSTATTATVQTTGRVTARSAVALPLTFGVSTGRVMQFGQMAFTVQFNTRTMRATYNPPRNGYIAFARRGRVRKGHQVELV